MRSDKLFPSVSYEIPATHIEYKLEELLAQLDLSIRLSSCCRRQLTIERDLNKGVLEIRMNAIGNLFVGPRAFEAFSSSVILGTKEVEDTKRSDSTLAIPRLDAHREHVA